MNIKWRGTAEALEQKIQDLPHVISGRVPDSTGAVHWLLLRVGMVVLDLVKDAYVTKSEGGTDQMGIKWEPLSPVTLILRRTRTGAKTITRLKNQLKKGTMKQRKAMRGLVKEQHERLKAIIYGKTKEDRAARSRAKRILEKKFAKGLIRRTEYLEKKKVLEGKAKPQKLKDLAIAGAFAMILRDTGRLLNSLSPAGASGDTILLAGPGWIECGSRVDYMKYHQSAAPRALKKDGTPRLPRRQILPDDVGQFPAEWWAKINDAFQSGLKSKEFWLMYLGGMAA